MTASPLQAIRLPLLEEKGVSFYIKRDDLLHPDISGNKWRKLKYNLEEAKERGFKRLLTFGGAYSNHLAATAAAGIKYGFDTLAIIRGEKRLPLNPTLSYLKLCGTEMKFVSRSAYRNKYEPQFLETLDIDQEEYYIIPEGGSNTLAIKGVAAVVEEIEEDLGSPPDYISIACGTGATMSGVISGLNGRSQALGVVVLKGSFMSDEIKKFLSLIQKDHLDNWSLSEDFHFGGYAKFKPPLIDFINEFKTTTGVQLDPIYTGKLAYALFELIKQDYFPKGSSLVMVHTGGLQGIAGFTQRYGPIIAQ